MIGNITKQQLVKLSVERLKLILVVIKEMNRVVELKSNKHSKKTIGNCL